MTTQKNQSPAPAEVKRTPASEKQGKHELTPAEMIAKTAQEAIDQITARQNEIIASMPKI